MTRNVVFLTTYIITSSGDLVAISLFSCITRIVIVFKESTVNSLMDLYTISSPIMVVHMTNISTGIRLNIYTELHSGHIFVQKKLFFMKNARSVAPVLGFLIPLNGL